MLRHFEVRYLRMVDKKFSRVTYRVFFRIAVLIIVFLVIGAEGDTSGSGLCCWC